MIGRINEIGIDRAVAEYTGFEEGSEEHDKITTAYKELKAKRRYRKSAAL